MAGTTYTDTLHGGDAPTAPTSVVTVNILGTNDAAVISGTSTASADRNQCGADRTSGTLTISDVDSAATFVAQADVAGSTYGTFAIDAAGAWTYTASSAHDEFVAGTTYTDTLHGGDGRRHDDQVVTVNILGTNDAAVLTGTSTASLTETNAALTHQRHADDQRRRQRRRPSWRRPARPATLRHLRDRRGGRVDLHGELGPRRVRGRRRPTPTRFTVATRRRHDAASVTVNIPAPTTRRCCRRPTGEPDAKPTRR